MSESSVDAWGIQHEWLDADERPHQVPAATVERLRAVIGTPPDDLDHRAPIVSRPGRDLGLGRVRVRCEDGSERVVDGALPDDFPLGYHRVLTADGTDRRLVVSRAAAGCRRASSGAGRSSSTAPARPRAGASATSVTSAPCGSGPSGRAGGSCSSTRCTRSRR